MTTAAEVELTVGQWVSTGWGAQHRVRSFTDTHVVFASHGSAADQRAERARVRVDAVGEPQCGRCLRAGGSDGLGPAAPGVVGEVRRTPEGWIAVCIRAEGYERWRFVGDFPHGSHGWAADWFMGDAERIAVIPGTPAATPASVPRVVEVQLPGTA